MLLCSLVVMISGSKSWVRVQLFHVKFGLQSSGFYRVITIGLSSGFSYYECFECRVSGWVRVTVFGFGSVLILLGSGFLGFRVPDFITSSLVTQRKCGLIQIIAASITFKGDYWQDSSKKECLFIFQKSCEIFCYI